MLTADRSKGAIKRSTTDMATIGVSTEATTKSRQCGAQDVVSGHLAQSSAL